MYSTGKHIQSLGMEMMEDSMRKRIYIYILLCIWLYIYIYIWLGHYATMLYSRNWCNTVNQLYFFKKTWLQTTFEMHFGWWETYFQSSCWPFIGHLPFLSGSFEDNVFMLDVLKFHLDVSLFRFYSFYPALNVLSLSENFFPSSSGNSQPLSLDNSFTISLILYFWDLY